MWQESNYFKSLEGSDKITYKKKLTLTDGKVLVLEKNWEDDVKLLPDLEWPHIYHYPISTLSLSEFTPKSCEKHTNHLKSITFLSADMCKTFIIIRWRET